MGDYLRFNAIILDPESTTRMRLKQASVAVPQFGKVSQIALISDALALLQSGERCDVVFMSCHFPRFEVESFITGAKETKQGRDAAYVLVLRSKDQDNETVAGNVMLGIDGFLFEPYSVDSLVEITRLATKVRKERTVTRERLATTLILTDAMQQLDLIASLKAHGYTSGNSRKKLQEFCSQLRDMSEETIDLRMEMMVKTFTDVTAPRQAFKGLKYSGVSSRVRKRMEEKVSAGVTRLLSGKKPAG